jgi:hypothetical protein
MRLSDVALTILDTIKNNKSGKRDKHKEEEYCVALFAAGEHTIYDCETIAKWYHHFTKGKKGPSHEALKAAAAELGVPIAKKANLVIDLLKVEGLYVIISLYNVHRPFSREPTFIPGVNPYNEENMTENARNALNHPAPVMYEYILVTNRC